ncbi:MAG TPA: hypothetical protein V6C86_20295 [Oculatellaceae cyanobacterium]
MSVESVLTNLKEHRAHSRNSNHKNAQIDFAIGRLEALCYASHIQSVPIDQDEFSRTGITWPLYDEGVRKGDASSTGLPFEFEHNPPCLPAADHLQFKVKTPRTEGEKNIALRHLENAQIFFSKAVKEDPALLEAELSRGWCYEQVNEKAKARNLFRLVLGKAYQVERKVVWFGLKGHSITEEAAEYLIPLLDPKRDQHEIQDTIKKVQEIKKLFRGTT